MRSLRFGGRIKGYEEMGKGGNKYAAEKMP